jgi:4-amino-4-deoxy-L-arabinose transferase-like glycosyltransferase
VRGESRGTRPADEDKDVLMPVWRWRLLAGLLILGAAALHVAYLGSDGALDLAPDEAHYWDWSRRPDWSYYSKGPLVAYLIRAGRALAGPWSQRLTGTDVLAVRLPAVVCGALLLASLYVLTAQVFRRERLACAVVAVALTLPVVAAGSSLMTIDAPYTCCWGWALVFGHQAIFRRSAWAWPAAGLAVGVGVLAKYTMVLWPASAGLFLLTSREHRRLLLRPGFWVMAGVAAACSLPILWWNVRNDWVTVRHVNRLAGAGGPSLAWDGPLVYLGTQAALLLGFWFVAWAAAMVAHRPWKEPDGGVRYLWWLSAPAFGVFLAFSVRTRGGEANWPVTAYLSGLVLAAAWLAERLRSPSALVRRLTAGALAAACVAGLALSVLAHRSDWAYPALARLAGPPTEQRPLPMRRLDPTCRLRGWRTLAAEVDEARDRLRAEGVEPVLAATGWALPGEVGFYCAGRPTVYSVGPALGDRRSQYDLWRPNPVADAERFRGRTFVVVGNFAPDLRAAFEQVEAPLVVTHHEAGQPVAAWTVTVCRGFRGFPQRDAGRSY